MKKQNLKRYYFIKLFLLLFVIINGMEMSGQTVGYATFCLHKKWGVLTHEGKVIIPPKYDYTQINPGVSVVLYKVNDKYGLCKLSGEVISEAIYDDIIFGRNGIHCVRTGGRWKLLDESGKFLSENDFDRALPFTADKCLVEKDSSWYILNADKSEYNIGKGTITTLLGDSIIIQKGEKAYLINKEGQVLLQYDFEIYLVWSERSMLFFRKSGQMGIADLSGKIIFSAQFENALPSHNLILVTKNNLNGIISPKGELTLESDNELRFPDFGKFSVYVSNTGSVRFVNTQKESPALLFNSINLLNDEFAAVETGKGWNVIDTNITLLFKKHFTQIELLEKDLFAVRKGKHWELVDKTGNPISKIKFQLQENELAPELSKDLAVIVTRNKSGVINTKGIVVIKCSYDYIGNFCWF